jgi:putative two-component system response regulator
VRAERAVGVSGDSTLELAKQIVHTHHERWDGAGYPQGLAGEAIPLAGRIIALVDVYDALVSDRPYRQGMTHDEVHHVIVEGRGTHFDPRVVDAFLAVAPAFATLALRSQGEPPHTDTGPCARIPA